MPCCNLGPVVLSLAKRENQETPAGAFKSSGFPAPPGPTKSESGAGVWASVMKAPR